MPTDRLVHKEEAYRRDDIGTPDSQSVPERQRDGSHRQKVAEERQDVDNSNGRDQNIVHQQCLTVLLSQRTIFNGFQRGDFGGKGVTHL